MIVLIRFRVQPDQAADFSVNATRALTALAARPGYLDGQLGHNVDDPELWTLTTRWLNTGSYRRAISSYDVKVAAVPLLSQALDEPSAYETAVSIPAAGG